MFFVPYFSKFLVIFHHLNAECSVFLAYSYNAYSECFLFYIFVKFSIIFIKDFERVFDLLFCSSRCSDVTNF